MRNEMQMVLHSIEPISIFIQIIIIIQDDADGTESGYILLHGTRHIVVVVGLEIGYYNDNTHINNKRRDIVRTK